MENYQCAYPDAACGQEGLRYSDAAVAALASSCVGSALADACLVQVTAGVAFTCGLGGDGTVWCWGANDRGQLGDGAPVSEPRDIPARVALPQDSQALSVGAGEVHACALDRTGRVYCWGGSERRQLGLGASNTTDHATPVEVEFPPGTPAIRELSVGAAHTCVVDDDEGVWCWGENAREQCGVPAGMPCPGSGPRRGRCDAVPVPTRIREPGFAANFVVSGAEFTCAIDPLGELWCWGDNSVAELGIGAIEVEGGVFPWQTPVPQKSGNGSFLTLDTAAPVPFFAAGAAHACAVVAGAVLCWGKNGSGQVGIGSKTPSESTPQFVQGARDVESGCTAKHTCAIDAVDRGLTCWGNNSDGQLGLGDSEDVSMATRVPLITVRSTALGARHTCALTAGNSLYCWGANDRGQLGLPASPPLPDPTLSAAPAIICPF